MEGNIPLSYERLPRGLNPRAIDTCPQDKDEASLALPEIIQNKLGQIAAITLCAIAANGVLSTDSAARQTETAIGEGQRAITTENRTHTHGLRVRECEDPPEDAPIRRQLRTMRCLHALVMPNPRASSGSSLSKSARRKTRAILKPSCGFGHNACDRPFDAFIAKRFTGRAENLAWGTGYGGSAQSAFDSWMHSPSHRKNIMNSHYDRFGVALRRHGKRNYWTAHFGDLHRRKK